jgi:hypothetical protein
MGQKFLKNYLLATLILGGCFSIHLKAIASEDDFLTWKAISAEFSNGVSIRVEADGPVYKKFTINAFNKSFELSPEDLNKIEGLSLSLLNITHEAGYEEVGGETVYFRLSNYLFVGEGDKIKTAVLTVQRGGITITEKYLNPPN